MTRRGKFDLEAELLRNPPQRTSPRKLLDTEPVRGWFEQLATLHDKGECTALFVAGVLTRGAIAEGLLKPSDQISEYIVRTMLRARQVKS